MNRKILVANWKMNPASESEAVKIARASDSRNVVICPPFPFLLGVGQVLEKASLGAQDAFWEEKGAYTGEVAPIMLKNVGVRYVIVGHSERRRHLGETDQVINKKVGVALSAGLHVILCVGEPLMIRRKGLTAAQRFVESQLRRDIESASVKKPGKARLIVAYEPIWAIGTGRPDDPKDTASMARHVKNILRRTAVFSPPIVLYGGSVTSSNVGRIFGYSEIDGALVGGASLKTDEFKKIISIASQK